MSKQEKNQAEAMEELDQTTGEEAIQEENTGSADNSAYEQQAGEQSAATDQEQADEEASKEAGEIAKLRQEAEDNYNRYLRVQADFDNFRRRSRQEKEEFAKYASMKVIEQLLPIVDNFERAMESSKESRDFDALVKGLEMVFRQLDQVFKQEGLEPIQAVGEPFNPEFHQAIMQVESDEYEEGIVVEEIQKGYKLKDKVVRPSMVKVSM
ncbi:nucleotide exchange factor GrpE [Paenibacillus senegalensis]|uniref:nucleotide exchange factor GrpE n=1 Tax=Paenibacillus senegalensis TaxID=1465766 RepID=UPI0002884573|nr:nucleotide exchange factor GrpE [Paenibacillus senegalensis]